MASTLKKRGLTFSSPEVIRILHNAGINSRDFLRELRKVIKDNPDDAIDAIKVLAKTKGSNFQLFIDQDIRRAADKHGTQKAKELVESVTVNIDLGYSAVASVAKWVVEVGQITKSGTRVVAKKALSPAEILIRRIRSFLQSIKTLNTRKLGIPKGANAQVDAIIDFNDTYFKASEVA